MLLLRREEISLKTNTEKEYFVAGLWKLEVLGSGIVCLNSKCYTVKTSEDSEKISCKDQSYNIYNMSNFDYYHLCVNTIRYIGVLSFIMKEYRS